MIQEIRYPAGINLEGGGNPSPLPVRRAQGVNLANRSALYRVNAARLTMAAIEDDGPFTGCANDAQLSFFLGKLSFSWALRGLVAGVAVGALGTAAGLYFLNKRR